NHNEPEAVILSVDEYDRLLQLLRAAGDKDRAVLAALRRKYDERLAWLTAPGAGETLDGLFDKPLDLGGKIFTGHEFCRVRRPRILVLAGVNGAGKSSVGGDSLRRSGRAWFNPDDYARDLLATFGCSQAQANAEAWQEG